MRAATVTLGELRRACLAYPGTSERELHGHPAFFVRDKHQFASFHDGARTRNHRDALWCPALPGVQEGMVSADPSRYFRPPYVGASGWIGIFLDAGVDHDAVGDLLEQAYRMRAPKACLLELDERATR